MKTLHGLIKAFLDYQAGYGLRPSTVKRNGYSLKRFALWLESQDIREVTRYRIWEYVGYLRGFITCRKKPLSPRSIQVELIVLKGFFDYLFKNESLLVNPMEDFPVKQKGERKLRAIFSLEDIGVFLDSIPVGTEDQQRDRALFELMYSSALRAGEIRGAQLEHVNLDERVLLVSGKGEKDRYLPFSEVALKFLVKYIGEGRKRHLARLRREDQGRFLFLNRTGQVGYSCMLKRFRRYLTKCGLEGKEYSPHSIRHATATHLLAGGASIRYVQELLGHEDLKTTQVYTRPGVENIKSIYRTYHPRENEFYQEIDREYLKKLKELKEGLIAEKKLTRRKRQKQ